MYISTLTVLPLMSEKLSYAEQKATAAKQAGEVQHFSNSMVISRGKCAICKEPLLLEEMEVHHLLPKTSGGKDNYTNLALATEDVHKLIHATDPATIQKYLYKLRHCKGNVQQSTVWAGPPTRA